ncbi:MAG TPA: hypothetical protein VFM99_05105, partial [Chitinophagales bacterium]|nr:hypothetical protein [Chitinophagales bacterium]
MELKYIWIEEYKNLKKIDFNFNHSVDETFNYADGILTVTKISKNRCEDFFSHNIKGLTAIVGKNGSGKTNLSEFLNYNLAHAKRTGLSTYIVGNGIIVIGKYVFAQEKIIIELSKELENKGYQISKFKKAPLDNNPSELNWSYLEKNKYIYYNPAFDFRILPMANNWDNIWNISTSYLAWNDVSQSNKHRNVAPSAYKRENRTDLLYAHARNEKIRESEIILNYPNISDLIGDLPTEMKISLDNQKENKMMVIPDYSNEDADSKHLNQLRGELDKSMPYLLDTHLLKEYEKELKSDTISVYKIPGDIRMQYFERFFWIGFFRIYQNLNKS